MTERVEGIKTVVACGDDRTKNTIISTKKTAPEDDPSSIVDVDSIEAINKSTWSEKWAEYRKRPGSFIMFILVHLATLITVLSIGFLLVYVLVKGIPNLNADIFSWEYTSDNCSLVPALINTVYMTLLSLLIAGPIGIFAAIYLVEYAKTGNKLVGVVRITAETLTGIPSIVYGLFGMLFFTNACGLRLSLISGALTLAIMVLPVIMRTTEEALMAVPKSYREGSFGLGAGKLRTVFKVVLPSAVPGILSGIILATGRIVQHSYTQQDRLQRWQQSLPIQQELWQFICTFCPKKDFTLIKVMRQRLYFWYSWCLSTLHQTRLQARLLQIKPISMCQGFGIRALVCVSNIRQKHIRFCN